METLRRYLETIMDSPYAPPAEYCAKAALTLLRQAEEERAIAHSDLEAWKAHSQKNLDLLLSETEKREVLQDDLAALKARVREWAERLYRDGEVDCYTVAEEMREVAG